MWKQNYNVKYQMVFTFVQYFYRHTSQYVHSSEGESCDCFININAVIASPRDTSYPQSH